MTTECFDFNDLSIIEIPVKLNKKNYILREADGEAGAKFKSRSAQCMRMEAGSVTGVGEIGELEPYLLSFCMFEQGENGILKSVSENVIKSWPARVVKQLFDKAKEISELNESDTVESLEKTIREATKKLNKLRGESSKPGPATTTAGSNSPAT